MRIFSICDGHFGCQFNNIWNELESQMAGHTYEEGRLSCSLLLALALTDKSTSSLAAEPTSLRFQHSLKTS